MCVCERERERVCERGRVRNVCEREREREREIKGSISHIPFS